ncbi:electron transfer flavoprotein subunit beta/FixA family protein [Vibrio panuliri]|uniref:Electron transfer flavoprotein subunit beta n=1 Tax=Vibrio panuliri TaxID=1381081 RepID=A0ABX3FTT9_9VIBR|nr:electron transfer flavoprotein subunit beta/FixA family protein [Vibrio panuliri]KAB1457297.1 electron transfer flavoprotein subunit beta/FixA family protein [Vibrio panuliri]OLQ96343.1 electron transporter RnfB [Vibrio panuliri]
MKILVPIKRVIDPYIKVRVKPDNSDVEMNNVKMTVNPFCEIAVEEAVRLKEQGIASEVIVVSAGESSSQEQLRTALALGADRSIHIDTPRDIEPLIVAKLLATIVQREQVGLVITGKQSIDTDNNQVAQMLAALLDWPQATFASQVSLIDQQLEVVREVDGGLMTVAMSLPAVISTDLRLNEPRFASLPNIMKAKKKPMQTLSAQELGVEVEFTQTITEVSPPQARKSGIKVATVEELIDKLRHEAKVIV